MNIDAQIKNIDGKKLAWHKLALLLGEKSLYELIKKLRIYSREEDYFDYEVTLVSEYFDWTQARRDIQFRTDVFKPFDPIGLLQSDPCGLRVKADIPLSEKELNEVIEKLPLDIAERYLRFALVNINQDEFVRFVAGLMGKNNTDKDIFYKPVRYGGIEIDGSTISFNGKPFEMGYHHRQAMRVFVEKQGGSCDYDDFKDDDAEIFTKSLREYPNINHTIRGLIYDLRKELFDATGERLIENHKNGGWYLDINP